MQDDSEVIQDDGDETPTETVNSTKQPLDIPKKATKRQRLATMEDELLEKAIKCIDQSTADSKGMLDSAELFGKYVASELRALKLEGQRWVKLQIQNTLFIAAQSENDVPFPQPGPMAPFYQPYAGTPGRQYHPSEHAHVHTPSSSSTPSTSPTPVFHMNVM